jgi:tellurite resistance protein
MDFGRILGALVSGAATPPRRAPARRGRGPFGMTAAETRQVGRVLGSLAGAALEAMKAPPTTPPPPAGKSRPARDLPGPAPRLPQTGPSPWTPRPGAPAEPAPTATGAEHVEALLLTQAMIAAARADGTTDAAERAAIARQLDTAGLTAAERDHVLAGFDNPATPEALAKQASDPMLRAQLYAACIAAMGEISAPERAWLDRLGGALKLDAAARASIEKRLA